MQGVIELVKHFLLVLQEHTDTRTAGHRQTTFHCDNEEGHLDAVWSAHLDLPSLSIHWLRCIR